jgi:hypothetical protein
MASLQREIKRVVAGASTGYYGENTAEAAERLLAQEATPGR